jgi:hypothetical protein
MDYWIIKAEAELPDGRKGILSCKFHERDSESTSESECLFRLQMTAARYKAKIIGPMSVVDDEEAYAAKRIKREQQ